MKVNSILLLLLTVCCNTYAQVTISGPECIVPGSEYQYNFYSAGDIDTSVNICLTGGFFSQNRSTCYNGVLLSNLHITWNDNITTGEISVTSASGNNSSFTVRQTTNLQGGKIDSLLTMQTISLSDTPGTINCTASSGGNCTPTYMYQWERSDDNLQWQDVNDAIDHDLSFSGPIDHTIFFRRRVNESVSNSIAYSDMAVIVVTVLP